jgi:hypothetical protein
MKIKSLVSSLFILAALGGTALPAIADGTVKVECVDSSCGGLLLRDVCNRYRTGAAAVSISCDDSLAGDGSLCPLTVPCGNGKTCFKYGDFAGSDDLRCYCGDGYQNDIMVTCR